MTRGTLGHEFSLLVRCCRQNFASAGPQSISKIPTGLDWNKVVALARRHRVQGLVWNELAQHRDRLPAQAAEALSSGARSIAATNLAIAGECRALQQAFARAKIPLLFVKGLTGGALAYRSPMLKMGWDIDLLVDAADLAKAADLLAERGYSLQQPTNTAGLPSWHARNKESVWSRNNKLFVELHTRLADNQRLIPTIDVHSPRQIVEVAPGVALPTLAPDELFAYLAVHGSSSAWFRLKWISDFAALLHGRKAEEILHLFRRSQELGASRAAGQALLLADAFFDVLQPVPELREHLTSSRATRLLSRTALRMLVKRSRDPTEQPLGTLAIHWTQFLLRPGLAYKASEFWRQSQSLLNRLPERGGI